MFISHCPFSLGESRQFAATIVVCQSLDPAGQTSIFIMRFPYPECLSFMLSDALNNIMTSSPPQCKVPSGSRREGHPAVNHSPYGGRGYLYVTIDFWPLMTARADCPTWSGLTFIIRSRLVSYCHQYCRRLQHSFKVRFDLTSSYEDAERPQQRPKLRRHAEKRRQLGHKPCYVSLLCTEHLFTPRR